MIKKEDYIIDFDRVNQLTSSIYDDPNDDSNPFVKARFAYSDGILKHKSVLRDEKISSLLD